MTVVGDSVNDLVEVHEAPTSPLANVSRRCKENKLTLKISKPKCHPITHSYKGNIRDLSIEVAPPFGTLEEVETFECYELI